eukprot:15100123-Alexandrium_andersonii.AAC.1
MVAHIGWACQLVACSGALPTCYGVRHWSALVGTAFGGIWHCHGTAVLGTTRGVARLHGILVVPWAAM